MNIFDVLIVTFVSVFVALFLFYLMVQKLKGKPINYCSYCVSKKGNKLLKDYRKKYGKRCG